MSPENRRANIAEEWRKSVEARRAAEALLTLGLWNDALNRGYYAAYHAACAVLLTDGLEARSHEGVISLFGQHFALTGKLPRNAGRDLHDLKEVREHADYRRGFEATEVEARREIARAGGICEAAAAYLAAGGWLAPAG
ncbi:MAG: HEPN domain-containing protein [Deltaproteobacteria bacterium]|nr:HEPN domain-containing protein [Deltaproteobacteria bacterium]